MIPFGIIAEKLRALKWAVLVTALLGLALAMGLCRCGGAGVELPDGGDDAQADVTSDTSTSDAPTFADVTNDASDAGADAFDAAPDAPSFPPVCCDLHFVDTYVDASVVCGCNGTPQGVDRLFFNQPDGAVEMCTSDGGYFCSDDAGYMQPCAPQLPVSCHVNAYCSYVSDSHFGSGSCK